jgi:hypothetical protein
MQFAEKVDVRRIQRLPQKHKTSSVRRQSAPQGNHAGFSSGEGIQGIPAVNGQAAFRQLSQSPSETRIA